MGGLVRPLVLFLLIATVNRQKGNLDLFFFFWLDIIV